MSPHRRWAHCWRMSFPSGPCTGRTATEPCLPLIQTTVSFCRHFTYLTSDPLKKKVQTWCGFFFFSAGNFCKGAFDMFVCWPHSAPGNVSVPCPSFLPWITEGIFTQLSFKANPAVWSVHALLVLSDCLLLTQTAACSKEEEPWNETASDFKLFMFRPM